MITITLLKDFCQAPVCKTFKTHLSHQLALGRTPNRHGQSQCLVFFTPEQIRNLSSNIIYTFLSNLSLLEVFCENIKLLVFIKYHKYIFIKFVTFRSFYESIKFKVDQID